MVADGWRPDQVLRWSTRSSTGKGERWKLRWLPIEDDACARLGFHLIGPALDPSPLSPRELQRLMTISDGREFSEELSQYLARCLRRTVPGYDIDVDSDGDEAEGYAAVNEIAKKLLDEEARRGVHLRVSYSSGLMFGGLHLEFGAAPREAARADLLHVMLRRAREVAESAGLAPCPGSPTGHAGVPLRWVAPGHPGASLDLIPLNHDEGSRQRLFRPLGGKSKDGSRVKRLIEPGHNTLWILPSTETPSPLSRELLAEAPQAPERPARRRREHRVDDDWEAVAASGDVSELSRVLRQLSRRGDNHDLRLALSALAIHKRLLDSATWIKAMGQGLSDREDARAAWASTATRIGKGQPVRGATWLRDRLGTVATWKIARGVAKASQSPLAEIAARFGRPIADHAFARAVAETTGDERIKKRAGVASRCLQFFHTANCSGCSETLYSGRVRCGWMELCPACNIAHLRSTERWLKDDWSDRATYITARHEGFQNREQALDAVARKFKDVPRGQKPLRVPYPVLAAPEGAPRALRATVTWSVFLIATESSASAPVMRGYSRCLRRRPRADTIFDAVEAVAQRMIIPIHLLERGETGAATELLEQLYCTHRVVGVQGSCLDWPSTVALKEANREHVCDVGSCECAAETPLAHDYEHLPTSTVVVFEARFPVAIDSLCGTLERGQRAGLIPPDPPREERNRTLRE